MPTLRGRLCGEQVGEALELGQAHPAGQEGPAGELPRLRRAEALHGAQGAQDPPEHRPPTVQVEFEAVLAGVGPRARQPRHARAV